MDGAGDFTRAGEGTIGETGGTLRAALDALPDGVLLTDAGGTVLWVNRRFCEMFRHAPSAARGRRISLVSGPFAQQAEGRAVEEAVARADGHVETICFNADGEAFPALVRARRLDGTELRVVCVGEQLELQRLRAELVVKAEAAARERETLRVACEALADPVLVADDSDRLLLANAAARRLFGFGAGEHIGRPLTDLPIPAPVRGFWLTFLGSSEPSAERTVLLPAGESRAASVLGFMRVRSPRGYPLASVVVVRAPRAAASGEAARDLLFRAGQSLRTPLTTLQGLAGSLVAQPELAADERINLLKIVHDESRRIGLVLDEMLELAQFDAEEGALAPRRLDLAALAREAANARVAAEPGLKITVEGPLAPAHVHADPPQLRRAVELLLEALLRRAGPGGGVEVSVAAGESGGALTARDRGATPRSDELMRLFEPLSPLPGVTGESPQIGLALLQRIVEAHGGAVHADAPAEGGLRVTIELP
jgi:PAS domain S-box-containing protein